MLSRLNNWMTWQTLRVDKNVIRHHWVLKRVTVIYVPRVRLPKSAYQTMDHFIFWISLSLRLSLSAKFGLRPKISQKVRSFFVWTQRFAERLAETKLRTEGSLTPKLTHQLILHAKDRLIGYRLSFCERISLHFSAYS